MTNKINLRYSNIKLIKKKIKDMYLICVENGSYLLKL
jgi:hypothetical protein